MSVEQSPANETSNLLEFRNFFNHIRSVESINVNVQLKTIQELRESILGLSDENEDGTESWLTHKLLLLQHMMHFSAPRFMGIEQDKSLVTEVIRISTELKKWLKDNKKSDSISLLVDLVLILSYFYDKYRSINEDEALQLIDEFNESYLKIFGKDDFYFYIEVLIAEVQHQTAICAIRDDGYPLDELLNRYFPSGISIDLKFYELQKTLLRYFLNEVDAEMQVGSYFHAEVVLLVSKSLFGEDSDETDGVRYLIEDYLYEDPINGFFQYGYVHSEDPIPTAFYTLKALRDMQIGDTDESLLRVRRVVADGLLENGQQLGKKVLIAQATEEYKILYRDICTVYGKEDEFAEEIYEILSSLDDR